MAKIAGYNGEVLVSGDGANTWHRVSHLTSADMSFTINTQNETTWDDRGFVNEVPNTITGTMSIEGLYDAADFGQKTLEKHALNKQKLRIQFFRDYKDSDKYYEFNAYLTSLNTPQDVENKASFTAELSIEGISLKTVSKN